MEKNGAAFARAYWYNDDNESICLSCLSVNPNFRNKILGTKLQELREQLGIDKSFINSWLEVNKESWMYNWYKRRGYIDQIFTEDNMVWMMKKLK